MFEKVECQTKYFSKKKFSSYIFIHFFFPIFPDVSSLRLDFESFNLLAGSTTVEGDPGFGCQDEFNVNGLGTAQRIPIICGSNNGHHSKKTPTFFLTFTHTIWIIGVQLRQWGGGREMGEYLLLLSHSSEIIGLLTMKCCKEMLRNLLYLYFMLQETWNFEAFCCKTSWGALPTPLYLWKL